MASINEKDPANELVHVKIETNISGLEWQNRNPKMLHPDPDWLDYNPRDITSGDTTYYISGNPNPDTTERVTEISLSGNTSGITFHTPIIQLKQHRKPDTYQFSLNEGLCKIRRYGEDISAESGSTTLTDKGGIVIVSACVWKNGDSDNPFVSEEIKDGFTLSTNNTFVRPIGNPTINYETKRVEWVCRVDRNDTFNPKIGRITVSFEGGTSSKPQKTVSVTIEAKEHTDTQPVLHIDVNTINNEANIVDFESYYTFDGFKKPINELWMQKGDESWTEVLTTTQVHYEYDSQTFKGKIYIPKNYVNENTDTQQVIYNFQTRTTATLKSPTSSTTKTIYQDGYVHVEHTYSFNVTPYYLPSKARVVESGVKTWINHIPSSATTYYVKIDSSKDGQYFYNELNQSLDYVSRGVRVVLDANASHVSHGWVNSGEGNTGLYKIEILHDNTTNNVREFKFTFTQRDVKTEGGSPVELGKFCYRITQMDKNSIMLYDHNSPNKTEPNYVLATMGSDLLTGSGFTASAKVMNGSTVVASVGSNANELGDSSTMNLCWGGKNTNYYGNQYIAFSPKHYISTSNNDVKIEVYGQTTPQSESQNGLITMNLETMASKPTLARSYAAGIKNIIYPSGSVTSKQMYHGRLSGATKTKLFSLERYYADNSLWFRRSGSTIPQYSNNTNYDGLNDELYGSVWVTGGLLESSVPDPINSCLIKNTNEYHSKIIHPTYDNEKIYTSGVATTEGIYNKIELYYDMTRIRLVRVLANIDYYSAYGDGINTHPVSGFNLSAYDLRERSNTLTLEFGKVDELNTYDTQTITRSVYISGPMCEFTGTITDLTNKKATTFIIPEGDYNGDRTSRTISWQDISDGSTDPNRLLQIKIDNLEDNRVYDGTIYEFLGAKNASTTGVPTYDSFSPLETFKYGYNSSTPRLVLGFRHAAEEYDTRDLHLLGMQLDRILDCLGYSKTSPYYFEEGVWEMNVYKWNVPEGYTGFPDFENMFLTEGTPASDQLTEAEYDARPEGFSLGNIAQGGSSNPITACRVSERDIDENTQLIIRLRMYDPTHENKKRFDCAWRYYYADLVGDKSAGRYDANNYLFLAGKYIYNKNLPQEQNWQYECRRSNGTATPDHYVTNMYTHSTIQSLILTQSYSNIQNYIDMG